MAAAMRLEGWRERLKLPAYQIKEAARYADLSTGTIADWHKSGGRLALSDREARAALSYLQLIEVAVVAAARKSGVKLAKIRHAREYVSKRLHSDFPFAEYRFKTNGRELLLDYANFEPKEDAKGRLVSVSEEGQLAWKDLQPRLEEFEYEENGIVLRWHIGGRQSPIVIDPRLSFGAPTVRGVPTWALRDRWKAGEQVDVISDDYELPEKLVTAALKFEGIDPSKPNVWVH